MAISSIQTGSRACCPLTGRARVGVMAKVTLPDPTRLNLLPYAYGFFPLLLAWLTDSFRTH